MKWFFLFIWIELIVIFSMGCTAPKQRRGDWMEHLNYRQFSFKPIDLYRQKNYYSKEELELIWYKTYNRALYNVHKKD